MSTDDQITITVSGRAMSGKTTIAKLIHQRLATAGVPVEVASGLDSVLHSSEQDWESSLRALKSTGTRVVLQVYQTRRTPAVEVAPQRSALPPTGAIALDEGLFNYGPGPDTLDDNSIPGIDE